MCYRTISIQHYNCGHISPYYKSSLAANCISGYNHAGIWAHDVEELMHILGPIHTCNLQIKIVATGCTMPCQIIIRDGFSHKTLWRLPIPPYIRWCNWRSLLEKTSSAGWASCTKKRCFEKCTIESNERTMLYNMRADEWTQKGIG